MSSFSINGRLVCEGAEGFTAFASATPTQDAVGVAPETRSHKLANVADPRLHVIELVATLAREIGRRGDWVAVIEIE